MYQALYRKWRPKTFDEVIGQEHITEVLKRQVNESRLSHAYLFVGTRGTGKTTCAKILAKAVNCEHPINGNPCCTCESCKSIDAGTEMDVVELDAASNNGVDDVRALRDEAIFSPAALKKRVYIIDEVHMLSNSAFNALLKILEEPPEHLMFILATTELKNIPNTILSRCQRHNFRRIETSRIEQQITMISQKEGISISPEAVHLISLLADGGMRDALSLLDQCASSGNITVNSIYSTLGLMGSQATKNLLMRIFSKDISGALNCFQQCWIDGKNPTTVLEELETLFRDILIFQISPKSYEQLLSGVYDKTSLEALSNGLTPAEIVRDIEVIQRALSDVKNSYNAKTIAELCIMNLCSPDLFSTPLSTANSPFSINTHGKGQFYPQKAMVSSGADISNDINAVDWEQSHEIKSKIQETSNKPSDNILDAKNNEKSATDDIEQIFTNKDKNSKINAQDPNLSDGKVWDLIVNALLQRKDFPPGLFPILRNKNEMVGHLDGDNLTVRFFSELSYNQYADKGIKEKFIETCNSALNRNLHVIFIKDTDSSQQKSHDIRELEKFEEVHFIGGNK